MPCTTVDHVYPGPIGGGPVRRGTQCWCGKRIWGGDAPVGRVDVPRVVPPPQIPIIPRPSRSDVPK